MSHAELVYALKNKTVCLVTACTQFSYYILCYCMSSIQFVYAQYYMYLNILQDGKLLYVLKYSIVDPVMVSTHL